MKKFKKALALVFCFALIAGLALVGTVAYMTDEDSDVNVMTVGDIDIEQIELQRDKDVEHIGTAEDGDLVAFKQNQVLVPAYAATKNAYTAEPNGRLFYWGPYVTAEGAGNGLWNDENLIGAMDKFVFVENTGSADAYYRTIFAFECPEGIDYSQGSDKEFMMNINGHDLFDWEDVDYYTIDGTRYLISVATYQAALEAGEISRPSLLQVVMTENATNEQVQMLGDSYEILVLSQACQTKNMPEAAGDALNAAFGKVTEENVIKWFKKVKEDNPPVASGPDMTEDERAEYNGTVYNTLADAIEAANENGGGTIKLMGTTTTDEPIEITSDITIDGGNHQISRGDGYTGTLFTVKAGGTLTANNLYLNGEGATATGNLIATEGNGSIVLNEGTVLENNHGAHAINLFTRGGGTLTINGAKIINNSSDSGAIWGGGHIIMHDGEISGNSSTGIGGAIRMVGKCNFTMNGGVISGNKAATDGGAIWGYGVNGNTSVYNLNGGVIEDNEAGGTGGAIYTGNYSVVNIGGNIKIRNNEAANSGAFRFTDHTSVNMTGGKIYGNTQNGESNAFNTWNNSISITGGEISDDFSFVGGLGLTIGAADIDGVVYYNLSTNHNTAYLAAEFNGFKFKVNEADEHFANFNFKPAAGYTYTEGDEAKLICMNEGYSTYWDAATGTFKLKAD